MAANDFFVSASWEGMHRRLQAICLALEAAPRSAFAAVRFTPERAAILKEAFAEARGALVIGEVVRCTLNDAVALMRSAEGLTTVSLFAEGGSGRTTGGWLIASIDFRGEPAELQDRVDLFISDVRSYLEAFEAPVIVGELVSLQA